LDLAVLVGGEVVGGAGLLAHHFAELRTVETGSWLGLAHHGRGLGTELRRANLHLAFAGLGALVAESAAMADNPASQAVSRKLGYAENGRRPTLQRDRAGEEVWFRLDRIRWDDHLRCDDVTIDGLEPCLSLLGAG
jgi:RimJ/RimL family protein N-acetyltransferase